MFKDKCNIKIGIIGLGYVGLPLAVAFAEHYDVVGFDINSRRINALKKGIDKTKEVKTEKLLQTKRIDYSDNYEDLRTCQVYIITVPTPIDEAKKPDLNPIKKATEMVAGLLNAGDVVIYESTVYPGCTEEYCVPILEQGSHLKYNQDFYCGYSPERINPGDKTHTIDKIVKVTSGSNNEIGLFVNELYSRIIHAGTHQAPSICVAEAAKVIENTQRDLNIALINELKIICDRLKIDIYAVLEAARTKWNFLDFKPGLVGGHCIGVDPYYLTYKAQSIGYHPEVILSGRRVNDGMGQYLAGQFIKKLIKNHVSVQGARILIMGLTFKENCPDLRNTKVFDLIRELKEYGCSVDVYDPIADAHEAEHEYNITLLEYPQNKYDGIYVTVMHQEFVAMGDDIVQSWAANPENPVIMQLGNKINFEVTKDKT